MPISRKFWLNTKYQSFLDFSFFNMQNYKSRKSTATFLQKFVTKTCSRSWKWTLSLFFYFCSERCGRLCPTWHLSRLRSTGTEGLQWWFNCWLSMNCFPGQAVSNTQKNRTSGSLASSKTRWTEIVCQRTHTNCCNDELSKKFKNL